MHILLCLFCFRVVCLMYILCCGTRWVSGSGLRGESKGTICCSPLIDTPGAKVRYFEDDPPAETGTRLKDKFRKYIAQLQLRCNDYVQSGNGDNDCDEPADEDRDHEDDDEDDRREHRRARIKKGSADLRRYLAQGVEAYGYHVLQSCQLLDYAFTYMYAVVCVN